MIYETEKLSFMSKIVDLLNLFRDTCIFKIQSFTAVNSGDSSSISLKIIYRLHKNELKILFQNAKFPKS